MSDAEVRILYGPGETLDFTPPGSPRTYRIRVPARFEVPRIEAEAKVMGGRNYGAIDMARVLRDELARIEGEATEGEPDPDLLAPVDAWIAGMEAAVVDYQQDRSPERAKALTDAIRPPPAVAAIEREVYAASESYRRMDADRAAWNGYLGLAFVKRCIVGGEGPGLPLFKRTAKGVDEAWLARVPEHEIEAIAMRAADLMAPPPDMVGNSASAPSGVSSPSSSTAESTPQPSAPSPLPTAGQTNGASPGSAGPTSESTPATS